MIEADAGSEADPFAHPALFYLDTTHYLHATASFVRDGLEAGDPVAVAVPTHNLALLREELGPDARDVQLVDMSEVGRNPGRILSAVLYRAVDESPPDRHVRVVGEPIWPGRTPLEYPACLRHEALINLALRGRRATVLCPYDATGLPEQVLSDAERSHPVVVTREATLTSAAFDPAEVLAETNRELPAPQDCAEFPFDAGRLAGARAFAAAEAARAGLDEDRCDDFQLAVGELAANSIRHGGGSGRLRVWTEDDHLVAEVHDAGRLENPLAGRRRPVDSQLSGRGLLMVHHLADLVLNHTGPDGTTTRIFLER
ncbi:anti-sigma factor RsbA family regulatory protein [Pseudonocardia sp. RS010]|uniref:anti-sigma factor RsbA family regulatory protein n=1 Tax=Pseudonocardia sp. RS010 TaxID=3385979 RepID=UPI0039A032FF